MAIETGDYVGRYRVRGEVEAVRVRDAIRTFPNGGKLWPEWLAGPYMVGAISLTPDRAVVHATHDRGGPDDWFTFRNGVVRIVPAADFALKYERIVE